MLHHAHTLKLKATRAFEVAITRRIKHDRIQQIRLLSLSRKTLLEWEHQLQLKLWRKDAFHLCRLILLKQYMKAWSRKAQQVNDEYKSVTIYRVKLLAKALNSFRLQAYRARCSRFIKQKSEFGLCRRVMRSLTDPVQIKARVMAKKLLKIANLKPIFDQIK